MRIPNDQGDESWQVYQGLNPMLKTWVDNVEWEPFEKFLYIALISEKNLRLSKSFVLGYFGLDQVDH